MAALLPVLILLWLSIRAAYRAMADQRPTVFEDYDTPRDHWYENRV